MKYEDIKKMINNVIENEFKHIQEYHELNDTKEDCEINMWDEKSANLFQQLLEVAPEHKQLLDDIDDAMSSYWSLMCRYYFRKGVIAGTTNLKFLEETHIMNGI